MAVSSKYYYSQASLLLHPHRHLWPLSLLLSTEETGRRQLATFNAPWQLTRPLLQVLLQNLWWWVMYTYANHHLILMHRSTRLFQPTGELPSPPAQAIHDFRNSLLQTFLREFEKASSERDEANTSR